MLEIFYYEEGFNEFDEEVLDELDEMRNDFVVFKIKNFKFERLLLVVDKKFLFYFFIGMKINNIL